MDIQLLLTKYNDEMRELGTLPGSRHATWNTPITPKQNYLNWMHGEKPMFIPLPFHVLSFAPAVIPDSIARHFVMEATKPNEVPVDGEDMFGVPWVYDPNATGSMVRPGNPKVPDIEDWRDYITLPDVASWDWEGSAAKNECMKQDVFGRKCWLFTGLFERLISWLDFEEAAIALIDDDSKAAVHDALDAITSTYEQIIPRVKQYFDVDAMYVHDDWGSQMAPFFSYEACEEMLLPYLTRLVKCTHDNGMLYDMHSCGHGESLLPIMLEAGIDSWAPQPMNDCETIFDEYGKQFCLQVKYTPPEKDVDDDEVVRMCKEFVERFSAEDKWAGIYGQFGPNVHPLFEPAMYVISREYYATH